MPQGQRKRKYGGKARYNNYRRGGKQLYKDVMYLKSLVNSELHYDYASYTGQNISSSGSIYHLSAIPQDDTNYGRSGNTVLPRYLNLQIRLVGDTTSPTPVIDTVRMLIFRWKDNSTPAIADVFENSSMPVYSPLNDNVSGNTKDRKIDVIKNKVFNLGKEANSLVVFYKKVMDLNPPNNQVKSHIKFNDAVTTAPQGGIYMILVGRQPSYSTGFEGMHKLSFHDN